MGEVTDPAVDWLLGSDDPSVRYLTLTEVLDESPDSGRARTAQKQIPKGPVVKILLSGQEPDGGFGVHPYPEVDRCALASSISYRTRSAGGVSAGGQSG